MIPLHRLTHPDEPVYVNPDLIATVEANPDTVVTLVNASKLVVAESASEVRDRVCDWRASVVNSGIKVNFAPTGSVAGLTGYANGSDDFATVTGLPERCVDLVMWGACARVCQYSS